jgi:hypothetical protein
MHDGIGQAAVTGTNLDHMENGRGSEEVPHLFQLARDQGAECRVIMGEVPKWALIPWAQSEAPRASMKACMNRRTAAHV